MKLPSGPDDGALPLERVEEVLRAHGIVVLKELEGGRYKHHVLKDERRRSLRFRRSRTRCADA